MVPALGFFVLAERRIVAGLSGSLKGLTAFIFAERRPWPEILAERLR
jgi:hypothetical protein